MSRKVNVEDMLLLITRLAEVMAKEANLLKDMDIKAIEPLQREKIKMAIAIETMMVTIRENQSVLGEFSEEDRIKLREAVAIFQKIMIENERRMLTAREVNNQVIKAIKEALHESQGKFTYNGNADSSDNETILSLSLNQTI